jgi:hypothetical protein
MVDYCKEVDFLQEASAKTGLIIMTMTRIWTVSLVNYPSFENKFF